MLCATLLIGRQFGESVESNALVVVLVPDQLLITPGTTNLAKLCSSRCQTKPGRILILRPSCFPFLTVSSISGVRYLSEPTKVRHLNSLSTDPLSHCRRGTR